jgi:hypothetical protein
VQFLCTRVRAPTEEDVKKLEEVLGYLEMTKHWTRAFDDSTFTRVELYVDALFAIHSDEKSQSACVVMLGNTLVHEACGKQKIVTKRSNKAELVALSDYLGEGELIEDFLLELGHMMNDDSVSDVLVVHQDNQSTFALVSGNGGNMRNRYMKVRCEYMKERLTTGEIEIRYKKTKEMLADVLTKSLGGLLFHDLVEAILGKHRFPHSSNRGAMTNVRSLNDTD